MTRLRGSCLCGVVTFEVTAPPLRVGMCHCSRCRKHSGGPGLVQARFPIEAFRLCSGEAEIEVFRPEDGMAKAFCRRCGSSLFGGSWPDGPEVSIRLGAFDDDPPIGPQFHTFVGSRAAWDVLPDDGLPRHEGRLPPTRASR